MLALQAPHTLLDCLTAIGVLLFVVLNSGESTNENIENTPETSPTLTINSLCDPAAPMSGGCCYEKDHLRQDRRTILFTAVRNLVDSYI